MNVQRPKYILNEMCLSIYYNNYNHSPSVLPLEDDNYLTAWYSGEYECSQDQAVIISQKNGEKHHVLEPGTGNPILFRDDNGNIKIIYSKFKDYKTLYHIAEKWKYCELYVRSISPEFGLTEPTKLSDSNEHLLARCSPISYQNKTIIPLYNELEGNCELRVFKQDKLTHFCAPFGKLAIQPSLFTKEEKLYSFCRNFLTVGQKMRMYDLEGNYEELNIQNNNSSVASINFNNHVLIVYNDTKTQHRVNLSLGCFIDNKIIKLYHIDDHGSYPSIAKTKDGLIVAYTRSNKIAVRYLDIFTVFRNYNSSSESLNDLML